MATDKEKLAVYFTAEERQDIDRWYQATDCRSRTEFIAEAVRFYIDCLKTGNAGTVLPAAIGSVIDGKLDTFETHMARLLFKQSVEMDMLLRMAADTQRLSDVHIGGLFPLDTAFLGGRGGMRAEGVNAVTASQEPYPKGISPPCGQRTGCPSD